MMNPNLANSGASCAQRVPVIRVLIADDHAMVRDGLRRIIESEADMGVCGQAVDGNSTLDRVCDTPCDVLLLDLTMPAPNGPELIRQIREFRPELPILVLTMHNQLSVARVSLQAGANGFITTDNDPDVMLQALRQVAAGKRVVEPRLVDALGTGERPGSIEGLSARETEVLLRLASGQSNGAIAQALGLSEKTVSTHKSNVMSKLKLESLAELVRLVDAGGLRGARFEPDSSHWGSP
jgi:DNA-binding NarL/FixJ family response regulator